MPVNAQSSLVHVFVPVAPFAMSLHGLHIELYETARFPKLSFAT